MEGGVVSGGMGGAAASGSGWGLCGVVVVGGEPFYLGCVRAHRPCCPRAVRAGVVYKPSTLRCRVPEGGR